MSLLQCFEADAGDDEEQRIESALSTSSDSAATSSRWC